MPPNVTGLQHLCRQFVGPVSDDDFLHFVLIRLDYHHVSPEKICFEITETAAIAHLQRASEFIARLRAMGYRFALDDLGIGVGVPSPTSRTWI